MTIERKAQSTSTLEEVNIDTSHMIGNSHTDNNRCCSIDTETPTRRYEHNQTSRNDKTPVPSDLCGDGPGAFLRQIPFLTDEKAECDDDDRF
jgi:hypothetical protein